MVADQIFVFLGAFLCSRGWLKTVKKLNSKLQKQQQGWPKISKTARKYNRHENLENYDSEAQMYARAHSMSP